MVTASQVTANSIGTTRSWGDWWQGWIRQRATEWPLRLNAILGDQVGGVAVGSRYDGGFKSREGQVQRIILLERESRKKGCRALQKSFGGRSRSAAIRLAHGARQRGRDGEV